LRTKVHSLCVLAASLPMFSPASSHLWPARALQAPTASCKYAAPRLDWHLDRSIHMARARYLALYTHGRRAGQVRGCRARRVSALLKGKSFETGWPAVSLTSSEAVRRNSVLYKSPHGLIMAKLPGCLDQPRCEYVQSLKMRLTRFDCVGPLSSAVLA